VRRLRYRHVRRRLFLQRQKPFRQRVQLALHPVDRLPLSGDLARQLLDGALLLGGADSSAVNRSSALSIETSLPASSRGASSRRAAGEYGGNRHLGN